jgi:hypothetical protein
MEAELERSAGPGGYHDYHFKFLGSCSASVADIESAGNGTFFGNYCPAKHVPWAVTHPPHAAAAPQPHSLASRGVLESWTLNHLARVPQKASTRVRSNPHFQSKLLLPTIVHIFLIPLFPQ